MSTAPIDLRITTPPSERSKMTIKRDAKTKRGPCLKRCVRLGIAFTLSFSPLSMIFAQLELPTLVEENTVQMQIEQLERLQTRISTIESENGPFDIQLLEPLESLARLYRENEDYELTSQIFEQLLQIHRINSGLYAAEQIPIVESLVEMQAATGEWGELSNSLDNLSWLYQRVTALDPETQLSGLQALGVWHLRALEKDVRERQAYHLVELAKIDARTAAIAEERFGTDNTALTPYLYNQALSDLYIALAITLTSETSQDLMLLTEGIRDRPNTIGGLSGGSLRSEADIEAVYGSKASTVVERSFKNNANDSMAKIERIKDLYIASGNIEAEAMALMYLGDATLIRQQFENRPSNFAGVQRGSSSIGSAVTHYREALSRLADAGISAERIEAFTQCPLMLPVPKFHETLQEALHECEESTETGLLDLGEYNLVSTLIPGLEGNSSVNEQMIVARVKFAVRTNGQVSNENIEEIEPDDTASRVQVRKLLDIMQFRPAFADDNAIRTEDLQLLIRLPNPN